MNDLGSRSDPFHDVIRRSNEKLIRALQQARLDLDALIADVEGTARALSDGLRGLPGGGAFTGGVSGGDRSDPTARLALTRDRAAQDRARLDQAVSDLARRLTICTEIRHAWLPKEGPGAPTPANMCRSGSVFNVERDGPCPDGALAAKNGQGRCDACRRAWYRSGGHDEVRRDRRESRRVDYQSGKVAC